MSTHARLLRTTLTLLCAATPLLASAQWQWIDNSGRKVFSDTAPPPDVPTKNILKAPAAPVRAAAPVAPAAPAAAPAAEARLGPDGKPAPPAAPAKDNELEARKKAAEAAEEAKKKAEADKQAQARADNCERARRAKATLDSGVRIATTNAKGEREVLDDAGRKAEADRIDAIIRSDCGPAAR